MNYKRISEIMESIKPGRFVRITYKSDMLLLKEAIAEGFKIEKITSMTTRFKLSYKNLSSYKAPTTPNTRKNPYTTLVPNLFYSCGDKKYVSTYPTKSGRNTKTAYIITNPDGSQNCILDKSHIEKYLRKTNAKKSDTNYMKINIDNIYFINGLS